MLTLLMSQGGTEELITASKSESAWRSMNLIHMKLVESINPKVENKHWTSVIHNEHPGVVKMAMKRI